MRKLWFWACLAAAALASLVVLYHTAVPARTTFFYDTSDTLYWAKATYDAGALVNPHFDYAALFILGGHLLMLPFIPFFGFGMATQLLGMLLFDVVFMAALWFFCSALQVSRNAQLLLYASVLLVLSSSGKLREIMWEHVIYYSLFILFSLVAMGLCFRLLGRMPAQGAPRLLPGKKEKGMLLCLALSAFAAGMNGIMTVAFSVLALAAALFAERFFDTDTPLHARRNRPTALLCGTVAVGALAGLAVFTLLKGQLNLWYVNGVMQYSYVAEWGQNALQLPLQWLRLLGVNPHSDESIIAPSSLGELLHVGVAILLLVVPVVAAVQYKKLQSRQLKLALLYHGWISAMLLVMCVATNAGAVEWRLSPAVFSALVVTVLYLLESWKAPALRRVAGVLLVPVALLCFLNVADIARIPTQNGTNQEYYALAAYLEENGLNYGYADFSISQTVTVFSEERVRVRNVLTNDSGIRPSEFQTMQQWYLDVPGQNRYFYVLKAEELESWNASTGWQRLLSNATEVREFEDYRILIFAQNPIRRDSVRL